MEMEMEEQEQPQQYAEEQDVIIRDLFQQGAEARVFSTSFMGRKAVVKERFSKKYRHPILDSKLTTKRLLGEARSVAKARRLGVRTPALYALDSTAATLTFEFVPGLSVKDLLIQSGPLPSPDGKLEAVASQIGQTVAKLHDGGLIHGDLTTSNMLLHLNSNQLVMIDFGLAFTSSLPEDKAVDLYVLERALIALHSSNGDIFACEAANEPWLAKETVIPYLKRVQSSSRAKASTFGLDWMPLQREQGINISFRSGKSYYLDVHHKHKGHWEDDIRRILSRCVVTMKQDFHRRKRMNS